MSDDPQQDLIDDALSSVVVFDDDMEPTPRAQALGEYVLNLRRPTPNLSDVPTLDLLDELRRRVLGGSET